MKWYCGFLGSFLRQMTLRAKLLLPNSIRLRETIYLDRSRKVVYLQHRESHYLLLLGARDILLDKWHENKDNDDAALK